MDGAYVLFKTSSFHLILEYLSSHSSSLLLSILNIIKRRFGDIFLLHLSLDPGKGLGTFYWTEAPVKTRSRSGHAALLAPSLRHQAPDLYGLFVFGGRDDESVHKCGQGGSCFYHRFIKHVVMD